MVNQRISNQLMDDIKKLTVGAFTGPEGARNQFTLTRDLIDSALNSTNEVLNNQGLHTNSDISAAAQDQRILGALVSDYDELIRSLGRGGQAIPQTTGDSEADEIMDRLIREGVIK